MRNLKTKALALVAGVGTSSAALAAGSPFDPITAAVDFGDVLTGVVAVAALVAAVLVGIRGVRWILAAVKR